MRTRINWKPEYIEIVRNMYPTSDYEEIAPLIPHLTRSGLSTKARNLGIRKTEEYKQAKTLKGVERSVQVRKGKPSWNKKDHPLVQCKICGKMFETQPCRGSVALYCSRKCCGKDKRKESGYVSPLYSQIECICETCGKTFMVKPHVIANGHGKYCSRSCCAKQSGTRRKIPAKMNRVVRECQWCHTRFEISPNAVAHGYGKFCSRNCKSSMVSYNLGKKRGYTSIELAVEQVLIDLNEPYKPQKQIGHWMVDFYLSQYKLVIECDGDYWHSLPKAIVRDHKKDHWLAAHNYKLLRLSEKDIKADAMKAVTDGLHKLVHGFTSSPVVEQSSLWIE